MPVFDPNVFDLTVFDTDVAGQIPAVFNVSIPSKYHFITGEQSVPITVYITSASGQGNNKVRINPPNGVNITIYNSANTVIVNAEPMTNINTGIYLYVFNQNGNNNEIYSAVFTALSDTAILSSRKYTICKSVAQ